MKAPYKAMLTFRRPALANAALGPLLTIIVAMEFAFMVAPFVVIAFLPTAMASGYMTGDTPIAVIGQLVSFGLFIAVLNQFGQKLHQRGVGSMIGPLGDTVRDFKKAALAVGIILVVETILPPWIIMAELETTRPILPWLMWMPITIAALVIQTGAEELYFRGYLQQQLACMSDKRWVWMGLPSLLFGVGHYMNGYGVADGVLYAIWATCLGLACADLTARTGNIGAATGLHLSNNLVAFTLIGVEGWPSNGLALFIYRYTDPSLQDYSLSVLLQPWAIIEVLVAALMVFVMWLAARIAIRQ